MSSVHNLFSALVWECLSLFRYSTPTNELLGRRFMTMFTCLSNNNTTSSTDGTFLGFSDPWNLFCFIFRYINTKSSNILLWFTGSSMLSALKKVLAQLNYTFMIKSLTWRERSEQELKYSAFQSVSQKLSHCMALHSWEFFEMGERSKAEKV